MRRVLHWILAFLLIGAIGYLVVLALVFAMQDRLLYYPTRAIAATPADIGLRFEAVPLTTVDGVRIEGWWVPSDRAGAPTVLFFHGNAGNLSHRLETLRFLHARGASTFIVSYRGYGRSGGRPSEPGLYQDAEAAWTHLVRDRTIPPAEIVVFGRSIGGAVAAFTADRFDPGALVLESTFSSLPDLAAELYPWLPARWLARSHFPTRDRVRGMDLPILVLHSREDDIIPFGHGQRIAAAGRQAELIELRGSHNRSVAASADIYERAWRDFLARIAAAPDG